MSFKEVHEKGLGQSEKGDYFQTMATILLVRSENAIYKACPTAECNKKVIDLENGMYRCEKCNREYPNFKYRLLVSVRPFLRAICFFFFIVFVRSDEYRGLERQPMGQFVFVRGGKNFGKNVTRSGVGDGERYGSRHCYFPRSEF
jgi:hypothetical protein